MTWLLTIWMVTSDGTVSDGTVSEVPVGVMIDKPICEIAGSGFERVLVAEDPSLTVMWKCEPLGTAT